MVSCRLTWLCSVAPSVVTSTVGSPRFQGEPGTWVYSGFVPVQWYCQGLVVFLDTLALEESCRPTEGKTTGTATLTSKAHPPCSFQVRESKRLPNRLLVLGRTVAEQGLRHHQQCNFLSLYTSGYAPGSEMADRRDWGGGGYDPEDPTQRVIDRIWESLTEIRMRMDQPGPAQPAIPVVAEAVPAAPILPQVGVEVPPVVPVHPAVLVRPAAAEDPTVLVERLAQNAGLFSVPERDRGARRVLIATPGDVGSGFRCFGSSSTCVPRVVHGMGILTSTGGSRRAATSRPGHDVAIRRVPNQAAFLRNPDRTELSHALLGQGRFCSKNSKQFEFVGFGWSCSRREDHVWSGRNAGLSLVFVFFIKCGSHGSVAPSVVTSTVGSPRFRAVMLKDLCRLTSGGFDVGFVLAARVLPSEVLSSLRGSNFSQCAPEGVAHYATDS
ncbi:hypothetical protein Taro_026487 [Colocasia esculenta]|uniref:Uncharacterized protein n=1 Tax=Colocasia esculenta TaxID=4460 RepID=A0A843VC12_COLES|nr:hypothetical protein [Colocasia esculenta]